MGLKRGVRSIARFVVAYFAAYLVSAPPVMTIVAGIRAVRGRYPTPDVLVDPIASVLQLVAVLLGVLIVTEGYSLKSFWKFTIASVVPWFLLLNVLIAFQPIISSASYTSQAILVFVSLLVAYSIGDYLTYRVIPRRLSLRFSHR